MDSVNETIEVEHDGLIEVLEFKEWTRFSGGDTITIDVERFDDELKLNLYMFVEHAGESLEVIGYLNIDDEDVARQLAAAILKPFEGGDA